VSLEVRMMCQQPNRKHESDRKSVGLPARPFLYTLDQISGLLEVGKTGLLRDYVHLDGISVGVCPKTKMIARNISPDGKPEWRVAERDLVRWLKMRGFRYYEEAGILY
jgi:hypothetical protein